MVLAGFEAAHAQDQGGPGRVGGRGGRSGGRARRAGCIRDGRAGQALGGQGGREAGELGGGAAADAGDAPGVLEDAEVAGRSAGCSYGGHQVGADHRDAVVADGDHGVAGVLGQGGQPVARLAGRGLHQDHDGAPGDHQHRRRAGREARQGRAGAGRRRRRPVAVGGGGASPQCSTRRVPPRSGGAARSAVVPRHGHHGVVPLPKRQGAPHHLLDAGVQVVTGRMIHVHHHPIRHHPQPGRCGDRRIARSRARSRSHSSAFRGRGELEKAGAGQDLVGGRIGHRTSPSTATRRGRESSRPVRPGPVGPAGSRPRGCSCPQAGGEVSRSTAAAARSRSTNVASTNAAPVTLIDSVRV